MYNCRKTMNDDVCLNVAQGKTFTFSTLSFSDWQNVTHLMLQEFSTFIQPMNQKLTNWANKILFCCFCFIPYILVEYIL